MADNKDISARAVPAPGLRSFGLEPAAQSQPEALVPSRDGIPLTREDDDVWPAPAYPLEHCCFCGSRTRFWYTPKDVAVCPDCAQSHDASDVPSKEEWCASPQGNGHRAPNSSRTIAGRV